MTATNEQLRTLIGRELEILPSNRSALNAADAALVAEYMGGVRAWLIEEVLCYWADDAIPDAVKLPLAYIVADQCKETFGKVGYAKGATGLEMLKRHVSQRASNEPVKSEYL